MHIQILHEISGLLGVFLGGGTPGGRGGLGRSCPNIQIPNICYIASAKIKRKYRHIGYERMEKLIPLDRDI